MGLIDTEAGRCSQRSGGSDAVADAHTPQLVVHQLADLIQDWVGVVAPAATRRPWRATSSSSSTRTSIG